MPKWYTQKFIITVQKQYVDSKTKRYASQIEYLEKAKQKQ